MERVLDIDGSREAAVVNFRNHKGSVVIKIYFEKKLTELESSLSVEEDWNIDCVAITFLFVPLEQMVWYGMKT